MEINTICVRTADSDVIAILTCFMTQFKTMRQDVELWVIFGTGNNRRTISINKTLEVLGDSISLALPFFHAFTGCDSTCAFFRKTKPIFFKLWMSSPFKDVITQAFHDLSWLPKKETVIKHFDTIEKFIVAAYKGDISSTIDVTRFDLFASSATGNLREIPPSRNALQMHVLRSAFQSGWVWGNTLSAENCPLVSEWGWNMIPEEDRLTLKWTEHKNIPDHLQLANVIKTCK